MAMMTVVTSRTLAVNSSELCAMISHVSDFKRSFERVVAARERLIELRSERIESLLRLRLYFRAKIGDFLSNVDPVTGSRFAELVTEGNKSAGDMSLTLSFFDGTRLRVTIDGSARISMATQPDALGEIERVTELRIRSDLGAAEFDYVARPDGLATTEAEPLRTGDFGELLEALVENTIAAIERQVGRIPVQTFDVARRPIRRPGLSFNIR